MREGLTTPGLFAVILHNIQARPPLAALCLSVWGIYPNGFTAPPQAIVASTTMPCCVLPLEAPSPANTPCANILSARATWDTNTRATACNLPRSIYIHTAHIPTGATRASYNPLCPMPQASDTLPITPAACCAVICRQTKWPEHLTTAPVHHKHVCFSVHVLTKERQLLDTGYPALQQSNFVLTHHPSSLLVSAAVEATSLRQQHPLSPWRS